MPELPEVHTTVTGLSKTIVGLTISDIWTDYNSPHFKGSQTIKDPLYFDYFKKEVLHQKIVSVSRRAKNILIHLKNKKVILIHMKMTGHIIIGQYDFDTKKRMWSPMPDERKALHDPFNRFIHFVITLSNKKNLVLSDMRKFAKVTLIDDAVINNQIMHESADSPLGSNHLKDLGPEPLDKHFTFKVFEEQLNTKPAGKIKTVLMDQTVISGIGNIYSDEALFRAYIHPEEKVKNISNKSLKKLYAATQKVLMRGIDFGGDSMSDYRNIDGERGKFQEQHQVYRKTGTRCSVKMSGKMCRGIIQRKVVGGRSAHFCPVHQQLRSTT